MMKKGALIAMIRNRAASGCSVKTSDFTRYVPKATIQAMLSHMAASGELQVARKGQQGNKGRGTIYVADKLQLPPDGQIPFKQWLTQEAQIRGVTLNAIYQRLDRGLYPDLKLRKAGRNTRFVIVE